ncbi:MAG: hypothetical protein IRY97_03365, partial [Thermomicrobiaceae bacterium]|nr:hypothetical protein [Thermomicrobiaceae bacterium]
NPPSEGQYLDYLRNVHPDLLEGIAREKQLTDDLIEGLRRATDEFKKTMWNPAAAPALTA